MQFMQPVQRSDLIVNPAITTLYLMKGHNVPAAVACQVKGILICYVSFLELEDNEKEYSIPSQVQQARKAIEYSGCTRRGKGDSSYGPESFRYR